MHNPDYNTYEYEGKTYHELDARMLWSLSSLDGTMTGIAECDGQICYAKCHQCYETRAPRYFWLYPLNEQEVAAEREMHRYVQKYFGLYSDFDKRGCRRRREPETWQERYWAFMRPLWNKSWDDRKAKEKQLGLPSYRDYNKTREAIGFFTLERIMENTMDLMSMSAIEIVYHSNYWDGALSGMCRHQGRRYWFDCVHDYYDKREDGTPLDQRIYAIYDLTDSEWKEEEYWHSLFEKYVGTHTRYENNHRTGRVKPSKDHSKFYDASKQAREKGERKKKELSEDNLIGYFDRSEMKFRKTKYRNYWIEGESPHCVHKQGAPLCSNHELVEWRNDAQKWGAFEHDFDGNTSGWAICIQPDGPDTGKPFWLNIQFCPWCGQRFKETGIIRGQSFQEQLRQKEDK